MSTSVPTTPSIDHAEQEAQFQFVDALFRRVPQVPVTKAVIGICVLLFLLQAAFARSLWEFPSAQLISFGGNFAPAVMDGQAWRLLTAMFLHGGLLHVALNMLAMWQVGALVERLYGHACMAVIYLAAGLFSSIASLWWRQAGVSVGASGAVFGMVGALAAWLLIRRGELPLSLLRELRSGVVAFVGYSLFAGFLISGIDNAAHIGGLVAGFVLGAGATMPLSAATQRVWRRVVWWLALAACVAASAGLWWSAQNNYAAKVVTRSQQIRFQEGLRQFSLQEMSITQRAQAILEGVRTQQTSAAEGAKQFEQEVVSAWAAAQTQLSAAEAGAEDAERKSMVLQYAEMQERGASLLAQGLSTGQRSYIDAAENQRLRAENLLLQWQLREARSAAPKP